MSPETERLLVAALKLPPEARAALAAQLLDSLDDAFDPDAEALWESEIAKRVEDLDSGKASPVPWSEARRRILGEA